MSLVAGTSLLAWFALERGLSPGATLLGFSVAAAVGIALCERLLPYRREWLRDQDDLRTDVLHLAFTGLLAAGGRWWTAFAIGALGQVGVLGISHRLGDAAVWPASWPMMGQLALALAVQDFCGYWVHRSQHVIPLLWRFHAVHHSAPRLYWLNQMRNHPVDALVSGASMIPLAVAGAPENTLALFGVLSTVHLLLQHANIDYRLGPFGRWLSAAQAHRWHHSRRLEEANGNYGSILLAWDALFGTRVWPTDHPPPVLTGLADRADYPRGYLGQLAEPFRKI